MTKVKELNEFTKKLIDAGYGNYEISQGYDCNYAIVGINIERVYVRDSDKEILLPEGYGYTTFDSDLIKELNI